MGALPIEGQFFILGRPGDEKWAAAGKLAPMLDDIKKTLWATADTLRANMDAAEYKHLVLGLIFVKYLSDTEAGSNGSSTKLLSTLRDTVLPRLISDQLRLLVAAMLLAAMGRI